MKTCKNTNNSRIVIAMIAAVLLGGQYLWAEDLEFSGGATAQIDYLVDGSVWIYDANVVMVDPAHIMGFVITGSGAVLDIYGGAIDYVLLVSTTDATLSEGIVTVYGADFAVDGVPVDPGTGELFLQGQTLSGVYENGNAFTFPVDCVIIGGGDSVYYQTVKLGWIESGPDIELSDDEYDFGQVDIGDTQTAIVTVYNMGDAALTLQSLSIEQDEPMQFDFTPLQMLPLTLDPNTAVDLEVLYTPSLEGLGEATLTVFSNDPNDPYVTVELFGVGVPVILTPEEQIVQILEIFNQGVQDDSIQGTGRKHCAAARLRVFGRMLKMSQRLINIGYDRYAIRILKMAELKCDSRRRPVDFIKGDGTEELNTLINELIDTLKNQ